MLADRAASIHVHRDKFGLALANRNYGANFYKNGAHLNGVLKHPGRLTNEAYDRLKGSFNRAFGGSQNAGGTAILEEGMDFQKVGLNPSDAAFNETKKATISDIARITGVPGVLLEDMDKATFGNMEQLSQMFVNYTIMPLCETIEAEFNKKIFFEAEKEKFTTDVQGDNVFTMSAICTSLDLNAGVEENTSYSAYKWRLYLRVHFLGRR